MSPNHQDQAESLRASAKANSVASKKSLRCFAVASGKGGVGKTFFSVNMAIAMAKMGEKVLLVDADLGLANVDIVLGVNPEYTINDVIFHGKTLQEAVQKSSYGVDFLAASSGEKNMINLGSARLEKFVTELMSFAAEYDTIIFDCGAGINKSVTSFMSAAPQAIVMITVEPTSIMDAYALIKIASKDNLTEDLNVVLNMVRADEQGKAVFNNLTKVTENFLQRPIKLLGIIPHSEDIHKAVIHRKPIIASNPDSIVYRKLMDIAQKISSHKKVKADQIDGAALVEGLLNIKG